MQINSYLSVLADCSFAVEAICSRFDTMMMVEEAEDRDGCVSSGKTSRFKNDQIHAPLTELRDQCQVTTK